MNNPNPREWKSRVTEEWKMHNGESDPPQWFIQLFFWELDSAIEQAKSQERARLMNLTGDFFMTIPCDKTCANQQEQKYEPHRRACNCSRQVIVKNLMRIMFPNPPRIIPPIPKS